jgi:hypothetical protein
MWKISWLHVLSKIYVALRPWLSNYNWIPHCMEFSWGRCGQLPCTLVKCVYCGSEKFILLGWCESSREPIMVLNFLLQDPNLFSPSKPNDLLCNGIAWNKRWVQAKVDHFLRHTASFCKVSCINMSLTCHKIIIMPNFPLN